MTLFTEVGQPNEETATSLQVVSKTGSSSDTCHDVEYGHEAETLIPDAATHISDSSGTDKLLEPAKWHDEQLYSQPITACRVCYNVEPDPRGEHALNVLRITCPTFSSQTLCPLSHPFQVKLTGSTEQDEREKEALGWEAGEVGASERCRDEHTTPGGGEPPARARPTTGGSLQQEGGEGEGERKILCSCGLALRLTSMTSCSRCAPESELGTGTLHHRNSVASKGEGEKEGGAAREERGDGERLGEEAGQTEGGERGCNGKGEDCCLHEAGCRNFNVVSDEAAERLILSQRRIEKGESSSDDFSFIVLSDASSSSNGVSREGSQHAAVKEERTQLIPLGCDCKDDLSFVHYACALRWFVSRKSIICEVCNKIATSVRQDDIDRINSALHAFRSARGAPFQSAADIVRGIREREVQEREDLGLPRAPVWTFVRQITSPGGRRAQMAVDVSEQSTQQGSQRSGNSPQSARSEHPSTLRGPITRGVYSTQSPLEHLSQILQQRQYEPPQQILHTFRQHQSPSQTLLPMWQQSLQAVPQLRLQQQSQRQTLQQQAPLQGLLQMIESRREELTAAQSALRNVIAMAQQASPPSTRTGSSTALSQEQRSLPHVSGSVTVSVQHLLQQAISPPHGTDSGTTAVQQQRSPRHMSDSETASVLHLSQQTSREREFEDPQTHSPIPQQIEQQSVQQSAQQTVSSINTEQLPLIPQQCPETFTQEMQQRSSPRMLANTATVQAVPSNPLTLPLGVQTGSLSATTPSPTSLSTTPGAVSLLLPPGATAIPATAPSPTPAGNLQALSSLSSSSLTSIMNQHSTESLREALMWFDLADRLPGVPLLRLPREGADGLEMLGVRSAPFYSLRAKRWFEFFTTIVFTALLAFVLSRAIRPLLGRVSELFNVSPESRFKAP
eukprot:TRINITY_DN108_c0_g1_i3.p1 TRINITY_DN108_c0_g1~~TRINITY_DN108_c0_g1_i3.p1  ORF type:complete len:904 (+),score=83.84 TRINITY_DN108_c0_g1_i3:803-3514(+)